MIKIRFTIGNWIPEEEVYKTMLKMCPNGRSWNNIEVVPDNPDFDVIFNFPNPAKSYDLSKIILFESEPEPIREEYSHNAVDTSKILKYYSIEDHHCVMPYFSGSEYNLSIPEKVNKVSAVVSEKTRFDLHKKRLKFCEMLDHFPFFDHYGRGNSLKSMKSYKGFLQDKLDGLKPYKYTFNCECYREPNYFTEKLMDCILSETLCFYDGCPNISDFINPECFVQIDINDFDKSIEIILEAMQNNEWEKRIKAIKQEKHKILKDFNPLHITERILKNEGIC